jgi:lysophospholipase L1-like esterase
VRVGNGGVGTVGVAEHVAASQIATWGTIPVCAAYGADLVGIGLGVNDRGNSRTVAQFKTDMITLITNIKAQGSDIVLCSEAPTGQTPQSTNEAAYNQTLSDLSITYNLPYYAYCERAGTFSSYNGAGFMFDALHPNNAGYWDWAQGIVPSLLGI